jgi:ABC-type polysaccharide/polyol phosphate transport system ATPase subunit
MGEVHLEDVRVEIPLRGLKSVNTSDPRICTTNGHMSIRALDGLTFHARGGERIGILGSNGAGKTTLLRVIAGLIPASAGRVSTSGKVHAVLNIGDGMRPSLTGRENAELRWHLLGCPLGSVDLFVNDVMDFADLGDFFDLPISTYSPGMVGRLLFAMSTIKQTGIFVLDEWLGVADVNFQDKAAQRLRALIEKNDIFIIASHSRSILQQTTSRTIILEHGRVHSEVASAQLV